MRCGRIGGALLLGCVVSLAQNATRIQENDSSIVYTGTWYTNASSAHNGGNAFLTNEKNAQATLTFNGTGVSWIGVLDPWAGIAWVYLDGTLATVDTYGPTTTYQQALFTARNLAPGPHTLSIQVTHMRDADGSGSWVWIDGFEIENGSGVIGGVSAGTGRIEQTSPACVYAGDWFTNNNPVNSGGSAALAVDKGSSVSCNFTGTGINWIGYRDEWSGIAQVYLDGTLRDTVDTYLSPQQPKAATYSIKDLAPGGHTLRIVVTGTHGASSAGSWIWVDAFDVTGGN
jgi:trimeric autotransporter adhesin